jgi:hypothetical protein
VSRARHQPRRRIARQRVLAAAFAFCSHAVFLAAILWQASSREPRSVQPLDVQLVRLPPTTSQPRTNSRPTVRPLLPRQALSTASAEPPASALPVPPAAAPQPEEAPMPPIGRALRAGLGCDLTDVVQLTANERRRCEDRLTANEGGPRVYAAVGPAQQAYFDANAKRALWWQQPFLATDPKNGCRPKVTNQQAGIPGGRGPTSDWRVTMGCAVSF